MKSLADVLVPWREARWPRDVHLAAVLLLPIAGLALGLLTLELGPLAVPAVAFAFLVLPWLLQDTFRLFIWLIVTWPLLTLYARVPLPAGMPDITYERVVVALIVGILVLQALALRRKLPQIGILVSLYVVVQVISHAAVIWIESPATLDLVNLLNVAILPVLMYWLTKGLLVSRWHLEVLLYALILASFIICVTGLYERALGPTDSIYPISPYNEEGDTRYLDVPGGRAAGVLGNPGIYGAVLGMGVLASLCCLVHTERTRTKVMLSATALVLLYGVLVSYTRSAWLSAAVTLFIAPFFMRNLWKKTLPIFTVGLLLSLFLALGGLAHNPIVQDRVLGLDNVVGRIERMVWSWHLFLEKPLLGWGPGALDILMSRKFDVSGFSTSHNTFLTILVDGGLVVFLSFSALLISWLMRAIQVYRLSAKDSFERSVLGAMTGCMLIFFLSGLAVELRYFIYFNVLFWIFAATIERLWAMYVSNDEISDMAGETWLST